MLKQAATRGALWGVAGQAAQVLLAFAGLILLARLLGKVEFGLAAMSLIVTGLLAAGSDWGMQVLCVQHRAIDQRRAAGAAVAAGGALGALVFLASPLLAAAFGNPPGLVGLLHLGAWTLPLHGLAATARARLARALRFGSLVAIDVVVAAAVAAVGVTLAWRGLGARAIVLGDLAGAGVAAALLWFVAPPTAAGGEPPSLADGTRLVGTRLADAGFASADRFLVGGLLGAGALGLYRFAFQHTLALLQRLTAVADQIALPIFSRLQHDRAALVEAYLALTRVFALVVVPGAVAGWALAPWLVDFLYPDRWAEAVPILRALCVAGACAGLNSHPGLVWLALGDTRLRLRWSLANLVALVVVVPIGAYYGVVGVGYALAARSLLATAAAQWLTNRRAGVPHAAYARALGPGLAIGAGAALLAWLA